MLTHYGKAFLDKWGVVSPEKLKTMWAEKLAGLSSAELKRGVEGLEECTFPPSLPEFRRLCRPPVNYEGAFVEAVRESDRRRRDGSDVWSDAAVYWAAQYMGSALRELPYERLRARWREALDAARRDVRMGRLADVVPTAPRPAPRLPHRVGPPSADALSVMERELARCRALLGRGSGSAAGEAVEGEQAQD
jgi:hypothetical protein